jgi:hypothetical protein
MQGVAVAADRRGEFGDAGAACGDVFGDAQGRGHVEAPGGGQVQHPAEVHGVIGAGVPRRAVLERAVHERAVLGVLGVCVCDRLCLR